MLTQEQTTHFAQVDIGSQAIRVMAPHRLISEDELLPRIAQGDEVAFTALFKNRYGQVCGFIRLFTEDDEVIAEAVQEIFTKLWVNRAKLSTVSDIDGYLFILSKNHTLNYIRQRANEHRNQLAYHAYVATSEEMPAIEPELADPHEVLEKAVNQLPARQQQVFRFRQQGLKNPEISKRMNLSIESVKKYQHLAMRSLSSMVKNKKISLLISSCIHLFF